MWIQVGSVCIGHCITRSSAQIPTSPVLVICKLSCENPFAAITFYACGPSVNSFRKSRCSGFTHFNFRCQLKLNTQLRIKLCSTCTSRIRVFFFVEAFGFISHSMKKSPKAIRKSKSHPCMIWRVELFENGVVQNEFRAGIWECGAGSLKRHWLLARWPKSPRMSLKASGILIFIILIEIWNVFLLNYELQF